MLSEENKKRSTVFWAIVLALSAIGLIVWLSLFLSKNEITTIESPQKGLTQEEREKLINLGTATGGSLLTEEESQRLYKSGSAPSGSQLSEEEKERLIKSGTAEA